MLLASLLSSSSFIMTNKIPDVSVIIPMYNAEKYITETLNSVLEQTFQNFEVLVVDDCSTDKSSKIVENFISKIEGKRIKLIRMKKIQAIPVFRVIAV